MLERTLPADSDERLQQYLKHVVNLTWIDVPATAENRERYGGTRAFAASGFILSVRGEWFWITAGHVCHDIEKSIKDGREIRKAKFFDGWANVARKGDGYPFPYDFELPHLYDKQNGVNYGLIHLGDQPRANLTANGVVPLDESYWKNPPDGVTGADILAFEMVGIAAELTVDDIREAGNTATVVSFVRPGKAPIRHEPSPPKKLLTDFPRFFGRLIDEDDNGNPNGTPLASIDGMSGSPIFGLHARPDGQLDYWLFAVQSGWDLRARLITGCPAWWCLLGGLHR